MTTTPEHLDAHARWEATRLADSRRGFRSALLLGMVTFPLFGLLDLLVAPKESLGQLLLLRVLTTAFMAGNWLVSRTGFFGRHADVYTGVFTVIVGLAGSGVLWMLDGFPSLYYGALMLIMIGMAMLVPWPVPVAIATQSAVVAGYAAPSLALATAEELPFAVVSAVFLAVAGVFVTVGQAVRFRSTRERVFAQVEVERMRALAEEASQALAAQAKELDALNATLSLEARVDGLTGLANRRSFDDHAGRAWALAARDHEPLSVVVVDIDFFKQFNDTYGHPSGDACLREVGRALLAVARRPGDLVGRMGGEEFALLLPDTDAQGALDVAERARQVVAALAIPHRASAHADHVTISLGVATRPGAPGAEAAEAGSFDALYAAADRALYRAKSDGRDRVVAAA